MCGSVGPEILISAGYSKLTETEYSDGKIWTIFYVQRMLFTHEIIFKESSTDGRRQLSVSKH